MTESEVWQQIELYAIEGNWTGVGVLGDWLQEQGIAEGETVCWWAKQPEPQEWLKLREETWWHIEEPCFYTPGFYHLPIACHLLHRHRRRLKALLT